ncbi:PREDICTED: interferon regulatory factor 5-like isoform X1 [Amphimedon queenslandica]|uniref:IRF tryptophan pentad repeat domain-containing protein n=1 Tax=Amphimedon queenslandica TaxID=400682 RepID=A0A1X7VGE1_AMPQE|nr:PREDICTED: interferon regulatory factor 5-like isoform X1 [Amphimedon queenslandica]|eukprot:XP_019848988.1 PREDICTED: interferon regulatory factor 5-like isoform X1 [Amphimedon queenslandica]
MEGEREQEETATASRPAEQAKDYTDHLQSSTHHSELPVLLKLDHSPSPDEGMTSSEPPVQQTMVYTKLSDDSEDNNLEINVDDDNDEDDDDNPRTSVLSTTVPVTSHTRPSVINLGASCTNNIYDTTPTNHTPTPSKEYSSLAHNGERPERMREWLVRMIDSGRFMGLEWMDQEAAIFRVPWVHAKKRDYNQERDAALFKEWAIHSGKYGDGSDVTTWKINFRCALNGLKDIIERKELEGPDCRVYQMLPSSSPGRRRKRRRPIIHYSEMMQLQSGTPPERSIRPKLELPLGGGVAYANSDTPTTPIPTTPIHLVPIVTCAANFSFPIPVATIQTTPTTAQQFPLTPSPTLIPKYRPFIPHTIRTNLDTPPDNETHVVLPRQRNYGSTSGGSERSMTPSSANEVNVAARSPMILSPNALPIATPTNYVFSPKTAENKVLGVPLYPPLKTGRVRWPPAQFANNPNALTIRIMYGSITVHMETFDCSKGLRIFYGPLHCRDVLSPQEEEMLFGPLSAHQLSISPRHPSPLSTEIFRTLKRGLIIEASEGAVYATALCRTVIYSGSSPMKNSGSLEKEEKVKVFDFRSGFLPELKTSLETRSNVVPKPYALFSFGQHWGSDRPLLKNLITLVVSHCGALNELKNSNVTLYDELLYEPIENQDIRIISPTKMDLEAEEFLNPSSSSSSP